ncbi:MAG: hypothetical protein ABI693_15565 [Bryobacteraceae bacterium]
MKTRCAIVTTAWILQAATGGVFLLRAQDSGITNIQLTDRAIQRHVKRMGINLGDQNYYDSGQLLKNLTFRNPGFEGLTYRSLIRCGSATASSCRDENEFAAWPAGFWSGAQYEFITGKAKGHTGKVTDSTAPDTKVKGGGVLLQFAAMSPSPSVGDYIAVRKASSGGAEVGWWTKSSGGGSFSTELADLPAGTAGKQALRMSAGGAGQSATLTSFFDSLAGHTFVRLRGQYRVEFKAKSVSGNPLIAVSVARLGASSATTVMQSSVTLTGEWQRYELNFGAQEDAVTPGTVQLELAMHGGTMLIDDVSLVQTDGSPENKTAFRDEVVRTLQRYNPGVLRFMASGTGIGDGLDNAIAPVEARQRPGYSAWASNQEDVSYGLHEFLELCEMLRAEPWYVAPLSYSAAEMKNLVEYLAGPPTSPYGSKRAARGHKAPWTDAFPQIHLELGNEAWNSLFKGESLEIPDAYGTRASDLFQAARSSPSFQASKFDLVINGQAVAAGRNQEILKYTTGQDTLTVAPYLMSSVDSFSNDEELFGPLFAEPQALSSTGYMRENYNAARGASHPTKLAVYEVNLHTTGGAISQQALNALTPSEGAGLAVASHMLLMLRELGVRDQMLFSLPQYSFARGDQKDVKLWGSVVDMGVSDRRRPQFLALQLVNEAILGDLVATVHSGADPTWDQPAVNQVSLKKAHHLLSFAFAQGTARTLVLMNLSRTAALPVAFSGVNAPSGAVRMRRLASAGISDNNEAAENVKITSQSFTQFSRTAAFPLPPHSMTVLSWQPPVMTPAYEP